jgi:hypothetical protein
MKKKNVKKYVKECTKRQRKRIIIGWGVSVLILLSLIVYQEIRFNKFKGEIMWDSLDEMTTLWELTKKGL